MLDSEIARASQTSMDIKPTIAEQAIKAPKQSKLKEAISTGKVVQPKDIVTPQTQVIEPAVIQEQNIPTVQSQEVKVPKQSKLKEAISTGKVVQPKEAIAEPNVDTIVPKEFTEPPKM